MHTITSDNLRVSVSPTGAELMSIYCTRTNTEHLWQGEAPFWPQRAPILFPMVGRLKNGTYRHNGREYTMGIHGFLAEAAFRLAEEIIHGQDERGDFARLTYEFSDTSATRAIYPFAFTFAACYTLRGATLEAAYTVTNPSVDETLIFGLGAHEGLRCPLAPGAYFDDYWLDFGVAGPLASTIVTEAGLLHDSTFSVPLTNGRLLLDYELIERIRTLVFVNIAPKQVTLGTNKAASRITVTYDAPHLAVWTQTGAPFVCIEPWYGLPDYDDATGELADKRSQLLLPPGAAQTYVHSITIK